MSRDLRKGDVVIVSFPQQIPAMHEQQGTRPAIIVGVPVGEIRYPLVVIVPLTTQTGRWVITNPATYPVLHQGTGNLAQTSVVLIDQIRSIDVRRIGRYLGSLTEREYSAIAVGINRVVP